MRYKMIAFFLLFIFALNLVAFAEDKPEYVGADKCKACHKAEKNGQQYKIWSEQSHAKAYKDLKCKGAADKIKAAGLAEGTDATKAKECLTCHSTAFGEKNISKTFDIEEGVTCEACHGPGSLYKKMNIMKDQKAAVAAGLTLVSEKTCAPCHDKKAAGHKDAKFDYKTAKETIAHMVPKENDRRK
jgi:hypothetical protein